MFEINVAADNEYRVSGDGRRMTKNPIDKKALSGVKVLEVCQMVAGPYCSRLLADLGAEVIKVEPKQGEPARRRGPFLGGMPHPEKSGLFLCLNSGKMGITLDLTTLTGRKILGELVKKTDVVIQDNVPQEAARIGLAYQDLSSINPRAVVVSITTFGQTGDYRNFKTYHLNTFHSGSEGYLTPGWAPAEYATRPPLQAGRYVGDYESGVSAAIATVAALLWQRTTGKGQHVDVSKQETLMHLNQTDMFPYPLYGIVATRSTRMMGFGGIMRCKDGHVQVGLYEEHQWQALIRLMGNPEWALADRFKGKEARAKNCKELNSLIGEWVKDQYKQEIYHKAQALGVPIAPYNSTKEVVENKQMESRGFFVEISHPEAGTFKYPGVPYRFSGTPYAPGSPAPVLGQHNREVYCNRLGFSEEELKGFARAGIISGQV